MGAGHTHGAAGAAIATAGGNAGGMSAGERYRSRLALALALVTAFFVVEAGVAVSTGSLALLSDAGHLLTDVLALSMALAAISAAVRARRRPRAQRSFGLYRLEIIAGLANALLLLGVASYVLATAVDRLRAPAPVPGLPLLVVGIAGLLVTTTAFLLLRSGARESLNIRGAMLEVGFDALSSAGVILAALVVMATGWPYTDPLVAMGLGVAIIPRALGLGRQALRVLLQSAPAHIPVPAVRADLAALPGVREVHDVHVWTLTSGLDVATAHLVVEPTANGSHVLDLARAVLAEHHQLAHVTLQVEPAGRTACQDLAW